MLKEGPEQGAHSPMQARPASCRRQAALLMQARRRACGIKGGACLVCLVHEGRPGGGGLQAQGLHPGARAHGGDGGVGHAAVHQDWQAWVGVGGGGGWGGSAWQGEACMAQHDMQMDGLLDGALAAVPGCAGERAT